MITVPSSLLLSKATVADSLVFPVRTWPASQWESGNMEGGPCLGAQEVFESPAMASHSLSVLIVILCTCLHFVLETIGPGPLFLVKDGCIT